MIDKKEIREVSRKINNLSSSGDNENDFKNHLDKIREKDENLHEYLLLKMGKDKTEVNSLRSNNMVLMHIMLNFISELNNENVLLEEKLKKLESVVNENKSNGLVKVLIALACIMLIFWAMHGISPESANAVIKVISSVLKVLTFTGG